MKMIPFVIGALGTVNKGFTQGLEHLEIRGQVDSVVKIGQNTKKSPEDLRRYAVTQTQVENHQLMLV